jgi:hypothetical protein
LFSPTSVLVTMREPTRRAMSFRGPVAAALEEAREVGLHGVLAGERAEHLHEGRLPVLPQAVQEEETLLGRAAGERVADGALHEADQRLAAAEHAVQEGLPPIAARLGIPGDRHVLRRERLAPVRVS